jgi:outer membrane protein insertion porin family
VIDVNVQEQPTGSLSFGANYSSDNGPALLLSFAERNFLGRGQELEFQLTLGRDSSALTFDFTEPQFLGRDLEFGLDLAYRQTDNADALYDTDAFRVAPSLGFPASERGRLNIFYALEYSDITDVSDEASPIIQAEAAEGGAWTSSVGYSYSFDTRRNNIDTPTNFVLRAGQEFGFGDRSFVQTTALAAAETRVFGEEVVLRATAEGGYLHFWDGSSRVTDRFFLGSSVLRGFERGGVGPRDEETDDALGGNAYAVIRLETEFPLPLPEEYGLAGGAFIDYGSVWDVGKEEFEDRILYNDFTPRAVVGLSLFWDTPVGPLRFNFTEPLLAEERDRTQNFDVTVSTRF